MATRLTLTWRIPTDANGHPEPPQAPAHAPRRFTSGRDLSSPWHEPAAARRAASRFAADRQRGRHGKAQREHRYGLPARTPVQHGPIHLDSYAGGRGRVGHAGDQRESVRENPADPRHPVRREPVNTTTQPPGVSFTCKFLAPIFSIGVGELCWRTGLAVVLLVLGF